MLDGKFEPNHDINPDIQIKLECLRLAKEFGVENDRKDPLPIAKKYYDWVTQKISKRKPCKCKTSEKKV
tara:strand:- start:171 stop:377 length:207 start_codon:yes stop_codon:yes gene_type:complete